MNRIVAYLTCLIAWLSVSGLTSTVTHATEKRDLEKKGDHAPGKLDNAAIGQLIDELMGDDFRAREVAAYRLSKLEEVPKALAEATKSADADVVRRARLAIAGIKAGQEERAFQAMMDDFQNPKQKKEPQAAKYDEAAIAQLVDQLNSSDFRTRENAVLELSKLDEVPKALAEAAKNKPLEGTRRAQLAIAAITARQEERAYKTIVDDPREVPLNRFIHRMVTDKKFVGDKQWEVLERIAKASTKKANELADRKFPIPESPKNRVLFRNEGREQNITDMVLLCGGTMPRCLVVSKSILFIDGDFTGALTINNSLLIVRGNVNGTQFIRNSIILATGSLKAETSFDNCFVQINNATVRGFATRRSVFVKTIPEATDPKSNRVLDTEKGPLNLLKFGSRQSY